MRISSKGSPLKKATIETDKSSLTCSDLQVRTSNQFFTSRDNNDSNRNKRGGFDDEDILGGSSPQVSQVQKLL